MFIKTFDIDYNTTISEINQFLSEHNSTLIEFNPQPNLPNPSITISIPDLDTLNKITEILEP